MGRLRGQYMMSNLSGNRWSISHPHRRDMTMKTQP